jgi:hypothetical protein
MRALSTLYEGKFSVFKKRKYDRREELLVIEGRIK